MQQDQAARARRQARPSSVATASNRLPKRQSRVWSLSSARSSSGGQKPAVIWLTGLSGAGKRTIASLVEKKLLAMGRHSYLLDGDNLRHGLNRDLGFTDADRVENVRRVAEVARLMADAGLIVITAFISPFRAERALARGLVAEREGEYVEVHVDTSLDVSEDRDAKAPVHKGPPRRAAQLHRHRLPQ